jgi:hypothetical protein
MARRRRSTSLATASSTPAIRATVRAARYELAHLSDEAVPGPSVLLGWLCLYLRHGADVSVLLEGVQGSLGLDHHIPRGGIHLDGQVLGHPSLRTVTQSARRPLVGIDPKDLEQRVAQRADALSVRSEVFGMPWLRKRHSPSRTGRAQREDSAGLGPQGPKAPGCPHPRTPGLLSALGADQRRFHQWIERRD